MKFLATTALMEFWDPSLPLVMLGEWCLANKWGEIAAADIEASGLQILPCPWNDRARFYDTIHEADLLYEELLPDMASTLNRIHNISHCDKYWRILLGPWLQHFIHVICDRLTQIKQAECLAKPFTTIVLAQESYITPHDTAHFGELLLEDLYNLQIFSEILALRGHTAISRLPLEPRKPSEPRFNKSPRNAAKWMDRALDSLWGKMTAQPGQKQIALSSIYLPWKQKWSLVSKLGRGARVLHFPELPRGQLDPAARDVLRKEFNSCRSELGKTVAALIPQHLPTLFIESFEAARALILTHNPKKYHVALSLVGWISNDPYKLFAAEVSNAGGRLIGAQHGGCYGVAKYSLCEHHEQAITDLYFTWGWALKRNAKFANLPSPKATLSAGLRRKRVCSDVVFVGSIQSRYLQRFQSNPIGGQLRDYLKDQCRFFDALTPEVRSRVFYREPNAWYSYRQRARLKERFPDLQFDSVRSFQQRLSTSRLVVVDNNATTLLEAFAADVPVIAYWQTDRWELRPEAEADFRMLQDSGILYRDPVSAAEKVIVVLGNQNDWWSAPEVRRARRSFINRYVRSDPKWAQQWVDNILQIREHKLEVHEDIRQE